MTPNRPHLDVLASKLLLVAYSRPGGHSNTARSRAYVGNLCERFFRAHNPAHLARATDPLKRINLEKKFFRAVGPCLLPIGEGLLLDDFCRTGEVLAGGIVGGGHGKGVGAVACPTLSALASKKNSCPENDLVRYLRY